VLDHDEGSALVPSVVPVTVRLSILTIIHWLTKDSSQNVSRHRIDRRCTTSTRKPIRSSHFSHLLRLEHPGEDIPRSSPDRIGTSGGDNLLEFLQRVHTALLELCEP
jgi:hypothetical protein